MWEYFGVINTVLSILAYVLVFGLILHTGKIRAWRTKWIKLLNLQECSECHGSGTDPYWAVLSICGAHGSAERKAGKSLPNYYDCSACNGLGQVPHLKNWRKRKAKGTEEWDKWLNEKKDDGDHVSRSLHWTAAKVHLRAFEKSLKEAAACDSDDAAEDPYEEPMPYCKRCSRRATEVMIINGQRSCSECLRAYSPVATAPYRNPAPGSVVPAQRISDDGGCFRKKSGEVVYLRFSESTVKHLKLERSKVWGMCYYGNFCHLDGDKQVVALAQSDFYPKEED